MTTTLKIEGMMCPHCEARVKKALEKLEGVASAVEVAAGSRRLVVASDCSEATPALADAMRGADVVLLDGLRDRPHAAHLTMAQASAALLASGCPRPFVIHIGHDILHADLLARLPAPVRPAFDGLVLPL